MKASPFLFSLLTLTSAVSAASLKIYTNSVSNGGDGGAYSIDILSGTATKDGYAPSSLVNGALQGFCLEPQEYFSNNGTYQYTIASFADGGGFESAGRNVTPGDTLSLGTTWLYSSFAQGVLANYRYAMTTAGEIAARKADNLQLQRAFWYLEEDYSYADEAAALLNPFLLLVKNTFGSLAQAKNDASAGSGGVWALNLTSTNAQGQITKHQSQLYFQRVPDGGWSLAFLGFAVAGLFAYRSRARS